ncbi:MAG: hypothetical protein ACTSVF_01480 [Candidatus Asgardarchaeia archaeon]
MTKTVVYFDERYPSSWIDKDRWGKKIVEYMESKGFEKKDAEELKSWLKERLKGKDSYETVVVFSQDMVPETVLSSLNSPNDLIRRYLDAGGRIVWIGDHPFWSKAVLRGDKDREEIWMYGAHYAMLGVEVLIGESSFKCEWIGEWCGRMRSRWYSHRPINIEVKQERLNLEIEPLAYAEVTLLPTSWNTLVISRWKRAGKKIGAFNLGANLGTLGISGGLTLTEEFPKELSYESQKLACAWHISFNKKHRKQGFYRLWDCGTIDDEPPENLLEDIHTLATLDLK